MSCFFDYRQIFPELEDLKNQYTKIRDEVLQLDGPKWVDKIAKGTYILTGDNDNENTEHLWTQYYLYSDENWYQDALDRCPTTVELLKNLGSKMKFAMFSRLKAGGHVSPHYDPPHLSNHVLRCHLGLKVPLRRCSIQVEESLERSQEGRWLVFDASKLHSARNLSREDRIILLIDMERPVSIASGNSLANQGIDFNRFLNECDKN